MSIGITVKGDNWGILLHPDWQKQAQQQSADLHDSINPALFTEAYYQKAAKRVGVGGRNAAWFIPTPVGAAVLRQYRRGGLVGKFNKSRYFFNGAENTRSFQEFAIINYLYQAGLTVPKALGAFYQKKGLWCEMALITSLIKDTTPLASICQQVLNQEITEEIAQRYARAAAQRIYQMHELHVWHADLNGFNILCSSEPVDAYLIDFDKAKKTPLNAKLRQQNLDRLQRSLVKVCGQQAIVFMAQIEEYYYKFEEK